MFQQATWLIHGEDFGMCFKERHLAKLQQLFLGFLLLKFCLLISPRSNTDKGGCSTMVSRSQREHGLSAHQKQDFLQLNYKKLWGNRRHTNLIHTLEVEKLCYGFVGAFTKCSFGGEFILLSPHTTNGRRRKSFLCM